METAATLSARYNELTGKNLKPGSYSKAKWIEMIASLETKNEPINEGEDLPSEGFTHCPHCGVHHSNGFATNEDIVSQGGEPNKTHNIVCLGCGGEFGPELEDEFTLVEAAAACGTTAKAARARYRRHDNDGHRTFYRFPRSQWDAVIAVIKPRR